MPEWPGSILKQRQARQVSAVGVQETGEVLGLVIGHARRERQTKKLAQVTLIQKPDHVRRQSAQAEACLRPQLGRREAVPA